MATGASLHEPVERQLPELELDADHRSVSLGPDRRLSGRRHGVVDGGRESLGRPGQGGAANFPDSTIGSADIAGATPFPATAGTLYMRIQGLGNKMRFTLPDTSAGISFKGDYYNNKTLQRRRGPVAHRRIDRLPEQSRPPARASTARTYRFAGPARSRRRRRGRTTFAPEPTTAFASGSTARSSSTAGSTREPPTTTAGRSTASLPAHQFDIKLEYYQGGGGAAIQLLWQRPGDGGFSVIGAPVASLYAGASAYNPAVASTSGTVYEVFMRAKVCDSDVAAGGVETNCVAYGDQLEAGGPDPEVRQQDPLQRLRLSQRQQHPARRRRPAREAEVRRADAAGAGFDRRSPTRPRSGIRPRASSFATRTAPMPRPPMPCSAPTSRTAAS